MKATNWRRSADEYTIEWGGCGWTLDASLDRIGLRPADDARVRLLTLSGLATTGRREDGAFRKVDLIGVELLHSRLLASFAPQGWHGLTVRAAWGPSPQGDGLDLEIQASTSTVGELRRLEILVESTPIDTPDIRSTTVEPRDRVAALLSYDGRERAEILQRLTTTPIPRSDAHPFGPLAVPLGTSCSYLEMVHPYDVSRRVVETLNDGSTIAATRYALFGYDLEKGVVLRGRLRGVWMQGPHTDRSALIDQHKRFLHEPPPLGG